MAPLRSLWLLALPLLALACGGGDPAGGAAGDDDDDLSGHGAAADGGATDPPDAAPVDEPTPPTPVVLYAHDANTLYRIDVGGGFALIPIGPFGSDEPVTDLAVSPDGQVYGVSSSALWRIDPTSGAASHLVDIPVRGNVALTFLVDGRLLASDDAGGVRAIDPLTGAVREVGSYGGGFATAGDLVAIADGTLFGISDQGAADAATNNILLRVDPATGRATAVGAIGFGRVFGMAYTGGHAYAFTAAGEIIEIDPQTGAGSLRRTHPVEFWGAAVTPRVAVQ